ncbi:hypothetical protein [Pseudomonas asplenii]|uniref:hypothetical protein n=1 Tax=Pseudomonas asplenii TaxID=53407 RepID=UPI0012FDDD67|nr:hypothetical protein [Pseudomonas asplenii]
MKNFLNFDTQDLAVMIGSASLLGAATNMAFSMALSSPPPKAIAVALTAAGFIGGRIISSRLRKQRHG